MAGKLIQLKLSKKKLEKYNQLVDVLGLSDTFGAFQRSIDFSIALTLSTIADYEKSIPQLETDKLDVFFQTIRNLRKAHDKQKLLEKMAKES